jgi:RNA-binding protein 39
LMSKLARTDEPQPKVEAKVVPKKVVVDEVHPSRCVIIKNVYNQAKYVPSLDLFTTLFLC